MAGPTTQVAPMQPARPARDEWERMLSGELYVADSPQQREANMRKRRLVQAINTSAYDAFEERDRLFHELFGSLGRGAFLEPPFNCDYGCNIYIGDNFYANMDCIFLDVASITIGDRVFFGPRVGLYTPYHPIDAAVRVSGPEGARPITIGSDVWFGGNVVVGPRRHHRQRCGDRRRFRGGQGHPVPFGGRRQSLPCDPRNHGCRPRLLGRQSRRIPRVEGFNQRLTERRRSASDNQSACDQSTTASMLLPSGSSTNAA